MLNSISTSLSVVECTHILLGQKTGGDVPLAAEIWTINDRGKMEFGAKKSNSWRNGTQKDGFSMVDSKKYPKKIMFNPQKVKKGSKWRHIYITQHRGSTFPRACYGMPTESPMDLLPDMYNCGLHMRREC